MNRSGLGAINGFDRDRDRDHGGGRGERRNTLRCYQDAPLDTPERAEEDRIIELVHSNTREEVDEAVMMRMNYETKIIGIESFFQALSQLEEVQDMEGIIYSSGLITKFMDDKFTYEALTLRGCHVVIGMFIQQARKHSERLKKESNKAPVAAKAKYLGTAQYLKLFFTCKLHDGRHDYRWKGIPSMSSKAALMIIVLFVTVIACVALIAVLSAVNTFTIESDIEVAQRLQSTVAAMDSFLESAIREMQAEYAYTAADLATIMQTSVSQFDDILDTVRSTSARSGHSTFEMLIDDTIKASLGPVEDTLFGLSVLKFDLGFPTATLVDYLKDFSDGWAAAGGNGTANRITVTYAIEMVVYNKPTDTVLFGPYTAAEARALDCVARPYTLDTIKDLVDSISGVGRSKAGHVAATLSAHIDADTVVCAMVETGALVDHLMGLIADKMLLSTFNNISARVAIYDAAADTSFNLLEGGVLSPTVPPSIHAIYRGMRPGENTTFTYMDFIGGAYMYASPYFSNAFIYVLYQAVDLNSVGRVSKVFEDGAITTLLAGVNPDASSYDRYVTYGEPTFRAAAGLPAISLALSGRSGAIFTNGYRGRESLTMYFPLRISKLSATDYAMLIERDLTSLRKELRASFLESVINERSDHHRLQQYFIKQGRVHDAEGLYVSDPSHQGFLQECFYASDMVCRTVMGDQICCAFIEDENSVVELRLLKSYLNQMIVLAAFVLIAVACIAVIAIGSIRLLTRLVLDHIEKDYEGYREQIEKEKTQFSELVKDVMPSYISKRIMAGEKLIVDQHPQLTFLFSDIVSFTEKSRKLSTTQMVRMLGYMFMVEDGCAEYYGIHKIKTIGDAYFCVSGLDDAGKKDSHVRDNDATTIDSSHHDFGDVSRTNEVGRPEDSQVYRMVAFATTVQLLLSKDYTHYPERTECFADLAGNDATGALKMMSMRMGIHSGPAIAGVVDVGRAPQFDCLGPSVNLASRMESTAMVDRIQLSAPTYEFLRAVDVNNVFEFEEPKKTLVKGYGTIKTYHIRSSTLAVPEILIKTLRIDRATRRRFFAENGILQETGNESVSLSHSQSSASHTSHTDDNGMMRDDYEVQPIMINGRTAGGQDSGQDHSGSAHPMPDNNLLRFPSRDNLFGELPPVPEPP